MTEPGEYLPPIPNNAIRRLEEALKRDEEGAEAALLTQIYNFFEVSASDARCPHRQEDEEIERGALYVIRKSTLVEEREGDTFTLTYERMYELDSDDNEALVMSSQKACFKKSDGEAETLLAELPNSMPRVEAVDVNQQLNYLDEFTRLHIEEG